VGISMDALIDELPNFLVMQNGIQSEEVLSQCFSSYWTFP